MTDRMPYAYLFGRTNTSKRSIDGRIIVKALANEAEEAMPRLGNQVSLRIIRDNMPTVLNQTCGYYSQNARTLISRLQLGDEE